MKNTAFITGATSGFGEAIVRRLSKEGYKIIALGRRKERLEKLTSELNNVYIVPCDIRDKDAVFDAVKNLPKEVKDIEILVNNDGLALGQEGVIDDFEVMIDTNIKGLVYATKAVLPIMKNRKSGYIFNLGSIVGNWSYAGGNVYDATKSFVQQFSFNLRNDLKGLNIRVAEIAPGLCKTEFSEVRFRGDKAKADAVYENTKFITADDISPIVSNCINMPASVNINTLEVMATTQTWAGFYFERD
ncbi:NAD(P)-dependent oxidoreductase [Campylobacter pinnipediorum subsp. pinnipediorum]|uniref:NAD(P)-dependent oxidoreductase n=1 Tax=Campylobacter pinnipediorum subsp. pinnipediorum TaxID=1660067 RepID=A0AAX0L8R2_9BACT|nr:SDR family NAD(P)-dependent oxidoreductase [Campylobacter pinnipediorum]OPA75027.1 NAD(P)-dependent oxidoreductase [Campylobacter pinnipediorum subsp. pinnipediorum]